MLHLNIRWVTAFICASFEDFLDLVCSFSLNIIKTGLFILFSASLFCSLIFEFFFIFMTYEAFSPSIFSRALSSLSIIRTLLQLSGLLLLPVISLFSLKALPWRGKYAYYKQTRGRAYLLGRLLIYLLKNDIYLHSGLNSSTYHTGSLSSWHSWL